MEYKVYRRKAKYCNFYSVFNHMVTVLLIVDLGIKNIIAQY